MAEAVGQLGVEVGERRSSGTRMVADGACADVGHWQRTARRVCRWEKEGLRDGSQVGVEQAEQLVVPTIEGNGGPVGHRAVFGLTRGSV